MGIFDIFKKKSTNSEASQDYGIDANKSDSVGWDRAGGYFLGADNYTGGEAITYDDVEKYKQATGYLPEAGSQNPVLGAPRAGPSYNTGWGFKGALRPEQPTQYGWGGSTLDSFFNDGTGTVGSAFKGLAPIVVAAEGSGAPNDATTTAGVANSGTQYTKRQLQQGF